MANFEAIEARSVGAVFRHLTNAAALLFDTGAEVRVIFDNGSTQAGVGLLGMTGTQPTALARSADVSGIAVGSVLRIAGANYSIAELAPDGTGMTNMTLERAA